jgi:mRNA-degrading endonuclease RelE of RelBE toxin-antitoxin system
LKVKAYKSFQKFYKVLSPNIQEKVGKQISLLGTNYLHPSLHTKKIKGKDDIWEVRIDIHYRMTFEIIKDTIYLRVVGNHDDVLRNP